MLVMSRQEGEFIDIGPLPDGNMVSVVVVRGGHLVRLGIDAPSYLPVHRREVIEQIRAEGRQITPGHKHRESDEAQQQIDAAGHDGSDREHCCPKCGAASPVAKWASWLMEHLTQVHEVPAVEAYAMAMDAVRREHAEPSYQELEASPVGVRFDGAGPLID